MKQFAAMIFIVITFLGFFDQVNWYCDENTNSTAEISIMDSTAHSSSQRQQGSECAGGVIKCHLGHCAFTLTGQPNVDLFVSLDKEITLTYFFKLANFPSSLFRPPIS